MTSNLNEAFTLKTKLKDSPELEHLTSSQIEIIEGLLADHKYISSKYFYDENGSSLFEEICRLKEYYPTRTEISILEQLAPEIMAKYEYTDIVELGSGEALKISILLNSLSSLRRKGITYYPVDISEKAINEAKETLEKSFPDFQINGVVHDFMSQKLLLPKSDKKLYCFFGSTIGNLTHKESVSFLSNIAMEMTKKDHFLLGFDNIKDVQVLEPAYNDSKGVTADFNLNILNVVNKKVGGEFNLDLFEHRAFYNEEKSRIEMHLIAKEDHSVWIRAIGKEIYFKKGESIHTENSRKYSFDMIRELVNKSGLCVKRWHNDPNEWFTVAELRKEN